MNKWEALVMSVSMICIFGLIAVLALTGNLR